jgi:hypothetical protein
MSPFHHQIDVDYERLARNAVRAYRAVKRIARHPEREPAWPTIMADLRESLRHRAELTEATFGDVRQILEPRS